MKQYTFEISLVGCNTNCLHCYVDGGPRTPMSLANFLLCLEKLRPLLNSLEGQIAVTLGNELPNHPHAQEIIWAASIYLPQYYSCQETGITTTGLALMDHPQRDEIVDAYLAAKAQKACLTLHGGRKSHDTIVRNSRAFDALLEAGQYFTSRGMELVFALMLNKSLIKDWLEIEELLASLAHSSVFMVIPLYLPLERLRKYQEFRAQYKDCLGLKGKLGEVGIDEDLFFQTVEEGSEQNILKNLQKGFDYQEADQKSPNWLFFNIDENLNLYYGNVGASTKLLGNLITDTKEELLEKIIRQKANYDYSAYYDLASLPPLEEIIPKDLSTNYIYPDQASCLYRWLDLKGISNIILDKK